MKQFGKSGLVLVPPDKKVRLKEIDAASSGKHASKEEAEARMAELREQIAEWQEKLYAESKQSLLIVLQAMDTGGKDGAVKHLLTGINPAGVQVTSFKAPTTTELGHDFLWRIHNAAPPRGMIGVWNRSHYEDVLITRVHGWVDGKTCRERYAQINDFEKLLVANGTRILKFYLHISKKEQKERLQARLDDPSKHWKFNPKDLDERKLWDKYQEAYEDAINACSTEAAPWHIVPANKKWARNIALAEAVCAALEEMGPRYPEPTFDPGIIVIE